MYVKKIYEYRQLYVIIFVENDQIYQVVSVKKNKKKYSNRIKEGDVYDIYLNPYYKENSCGRDLIEPIIIHNYYIYTECWWL